MHRLPMPTPPPSPPSASCSCGMGVFFFFLPSLSSSPAHLHWHLVIVHGPAAKRSLFFHYARPAPLVVLFARPPRGNHE